MTERLSRREKERVKEMEREIERETDRERGSSGESKEKETHIALECGGEGARGVRKYQQEGGE